MTAIIIEVDTAVHAAYIQLSDEPVARTVDLNGEILIDLDQYDVAVGIEVLDEGTPLPFDRLVSDFHVRTDVIGILRQIRPDVSSFLASPLSQGNDGKTQAQNARRLEPLA